jgi:hypothetical protein
MKVIGTMICYFKFLLHPAPQNSPAGRPSWGQVVLQGFQAPGALGRNLKINVKGSVQRKLRWVETGVNRWV